MRIMPVLAALDADSDGELSATEIENASKALHRLDKNGDGKLTFEEMRPDPREMANGMGRPGDGEGPVGPQGGPALMLRMFESRDANDDGKLSGDEIPEPMRGRMERIDQNGDGAISREEVERAAEMFRDRAGGPGAGGPGAGGPGAGRGPRAGRGPDRGENEGPVRPRRPSDDDRS